MQHSSTIEWLLLVQILVLYYNDYFNTPNGLMMSDTHDIHDQHTAKSTEITPSLDQSQTVDNAHYLFSSSLAKTFSIVQLQRLVGNRAVQRLLMAPAPIIQRGMKRLRENNSDQSGKKQKIGDEITTDYWSRASVSVIGGGVNISAADVSIGDVAISTKRRPTAQEPDQGDHIVAWSSMHAYWEKTLSHSTLAQALTCLKQWLLEDQVYEDKSGKGQEADKTLRLKALTLIDTLETTPAPIETLMNQFEVAMSMFIRANQHSSFATIGKASGGHGEASAMAVLQDAENTVEDDPSEIDGEIISDIALTLLDKTKIGGNNDLIAKSVHTWVKMLKGSYPNLDANNKFNELDNVDISGAKVSAWLVHWNSLFDPKKQDYHNNNGTLKNEHKTNTTGNDLTAHTLVQSMITPTDDKQATAYEGKDVLLSNLEIPDDRADTQFAPNQGAHTVAWTFLRQSLMRQLTNKTVEEAIAILKKHYESDKAAVDLGKGRPYVVAQVKSGHDNIQKLLDTITGKKLSVTEWKDIVSTLVGLYIETNQKMTSTTYAGAYTPTGHGEGATNTAFNTGNYSKNDDYDGLVAVAHKFIDLGIFYKPLLTDVQNYATDRKLGDPLKTGKTDSLDLLIKKGGDLTITDKSADKIFDEFIMLNVFRQSTISKRLKDLDITRFDELLKMVTATVNLLEQDEMNKENLVDGITNADPEQNAAIKRFLDNQFLTVLKDDDAFDDKQKSLLTRMKKLHTTVSNIRNGNPTVKAQAAERQKDLGEKLGAPQTYFENLYAVQEPIVQKIIGDYWGLLPSYHAQFYADLKADKAAKTKILNHIFTDPLAEKDMMIGAPIKIHLQNSYGSFMNQFLIKLKEVVADKVDGLMPDV